MTTTPHEEGLDIVVVNYRTPNSLHRFLESLVNYPPSVPYNVWVYNVSPQYKDLRIVSDFSRKLLTLKAMGADDNVGYGRAVNNAGARGSHDVIAVFNADVEVTPGSLDNCRQALIDQEDWGLLGPRQIDSAGLITHGGIVGPPDDPRFRTFKSHHSGYEDVLDDVPTIMGSAVFIKRTVWNELRACPLYQGFGTTFYGRIPVGPFLETQLYFEETWAAYHARKHGWKVVYYGSVTMGHEWHVSIDLHAADIQNTWFDKSQEDFRACCRAHEIVHN